MKSKHFAAVKVPGAEVEFCSNRRNEMILVTSYPTRRGATRCESRADNSSVGGEGCTDMWRSHNF
jgi:hypothetical protein